MISDSWDQDQEVVWENSNYPKTNPDHQLCPEKLTQLNVNH